MKASKERLDLVRETVANYGYTEAARRLGIKRETVRRYMRHVENQDDPNGKKAEVADDSDAIRKIKERFSAAELKAIANGGLGVRDIATQNIEPTTDVYKLGIMTDTHYGSKYTDPALTNLAWTLTAGSL